MNKKISIIIPCRNEEKHIGKVIENIINQDYPKINIEILVIDGNSDDLTVSIINSYIVKGHNILLLSNPNKFVPFALNIGIMKAKGEIIIRMDAHAEYPHNYISSLVANLVTLKADNVGGVWITTPGNSSLKSKAIALVLSHKFGVGNALFRVGVAKPIETDTVPFGCYPIEVFKKIGLFDVDMLRNQDDEFNGRLKKQGGKIFLVPYIKIKYFARTNFSELLKMYFQYGFFKPLVAKKLKQPTNVRQFIPPLFILLLFTSIIINFVYPLVFFVNIFIILVYIAISIQIAKSFSYKQVLYVLLALLIIHFGYGIGYIKGILYTFILNKKLKIDS